MISIRTTILILCLIYPVTALQGEVKIQKASKTARVIHDTGSGVSGSIDFTIRHSGAEANWFVTFSAGSSGTTSSRTAVGTSGGTYHYNIYDSNLNLNILRDISDNPSAGDSINGVFTASNKPVSEDHSAVIYIPPGYFPPSEDYTDILTLSLFEGTFDNYVLVETKDIELIFQVPEVLELSIVDRGAPLDTSATTRNMDFGILRTGQIQQADIVVRATSPYNLLLTSANQGGLIRTDIQDSSVIPYFCYVDGTLVNLSGFSAVTASSGMKTDYSGNRHEVDIEIGDVWNFTAGEFEDVITVTVETQW